MRSKLKLSRSLELISAFFKEQQVINTRGGGANLAPPPGPDRVKNINQMNSSRLLGLAGLASSATSKLFAPI